MQPVQNDTDMAGPGIKRAFFVLTILGAYLMIALVWYVGHHTNYVLKYHMNSMLKSIVPTFSTEQYSIQLSTGAEINEPQTRVAFGVTKIPSQMGGKNTSWEFKSNQTLSLPSKTIHTHTTAIEDSVTTVQLEGPNNITTSPSAPTTAAETYQSRLPPHNYTLTHAPTSGYILIVAYREQLESAVWDMYQLLCLAVEWNMKLVEPFLMDSYFGVPKSQPGEAIFRFRDLYNMTAVNEQLRECTHAAYLPIASYEEFAAQSYAGVWLLDFMRAECSAIARRREGEVIESRINALSSKVSGNGNLHISEVHCVNAKKVIHFKDLPSSLGIPIPKPRNPDADTNDTKKAHTNQQVGIVFRDWTGIRNKPDKFFYHDPDFHPFSCPHIHTLEHSRTVKAAAQLLFAHLRLTRPLLGIHIRLERVMKLDVEKPGTTEECLRKLMNTVKALKVKYSLRDDQVLALRDYGALGSQSCKRRSCNKIATHLQIDAQLTALGLRLADYNPAVLQIPNHSGLASTVEKELISTSDYLLTVGWGSFQRSIRDRILKSHPEGGVERVYSLCSGDGDKLPDLIINTY